MPNGPETNGDPWARMREQQADWEERQSAYIRGRKLTEIIRSTETPEAVWWAMRTHVAHEERLGGLTFVESENRYSRDAMVGIFADRVAECKMLLKPDLVKTLGLDRNKELGFAPDSTKLTSVELKKLIDSLGAASKEFWARWRILGAYRQHRGAGQDLETVTVKVFTSPTKVILEGEHFATVGRAKETLPGAKPFGDLLDEAMRLWDEIGEHRVPKRDESGKIVKDEEGNEIMKDLSIFDRSVYEDRVQVALEYVTGKIVGGDISKEERPYDFYWEDAENAAHLGLQIARILNMDSRWATSSVAEPVDSAFVEYLLHGYSGKVTHDFELGLGVSDLAKIQYFILRQLGEFGRDSPRQIVMPAIAGCVPNLTMDFMRMATVEGKRPKTDEEIKHDKKEFEEKKKKEFEEKWRSVVKSEKEIEEKVKEAIEKIEKEKVVEYINLYALWKEMGVRFGDLPWDSEKWKGGAQYFQQKFGGEGWEAGGLPKDLLDIPLTLQQFYAVAIVFEMVTRKDLDRAFEDIQNGNHLLAQNKGFELAFAVQINGSGLARLEKEKKTMTKIRQLTKMNAEIGIAVANTPDHFINKRKRFDKVTSRPTASPRALREGQFPQSYGVEADFDRKIDNMIEAGEKSGFLTSADPDDKWSVGQLEREKELLAKAIGGFGALKQVVQGLGFKKGYVPTRKGFLPSETGWFDKEEIEAIKKSGLYAPYNQV